MILYAGTELNESQSLNAPRDVAIAGLPAQLGWALAPRPGRLICKDLDL